MSAPRPRARRPSVAGAHAEWLRLVEPHGPFLTLPVLRRVWPGGLDHADADTRAELRRRLAGLDLADPASRTALVEWVLRDLLAYGRRLAAGPEVPATIAHVVAEHGAVLRPDYALLQPDGPDDGPRPRLLVTVHPPGARLDTRPPGDRWSASPVDRLALLCRAAGVEVGLATDATTWMLVWAPRNGATGTATFPVDLFPEEPVLLDAFTSLLGARRFFAVAGGDQLEALLRESASAQAEVTGKLGQQVRQAVELLVAALSRADRDRDGALLTGVDPHTVYEAAVAVLMRLVFLLYGEERGLLPLGDDLYDRNLATSTVLDQLRAAQARSGDEPLERSQAAWHRLLALFRAVHGGIAHDRLRIPAYGGGLFDPDRFPFLEGRRPGERWRDTAARPIPVDDLTVLAVVSALQELRFTEGGATETRRLTYRALDVEQIGHVYEGLLDHSAVAVTGTSLGLVGKAGQEPEVALADLHAAAAKGRDALVGWLTDQTKRSPKQIERLLDTPADADTLRLLRAACDNDETLTDELTPYLHLLRLNLRGLPTVFPAGSMYVTQTGSKRDSGTAYTTRELAEEVVEHALAPIVYRPGPAEGADPADWRLKPATELLDLKVCDPAVGSGAILVAACRYLADRLVEAWATEGAPEAEGDPEEVVIAARRAIADRCLYGVDRDPMAVEMAKLSLWLVTLSKERPFSFLDHALKAGDSLLGITGLDQLRALHLDPAVGRAKVGLSLNSTALERAVERAIELRRKLESIPVISVADAEDKARLNADADAEINGLRTIADLVVGCALRAELPGRPPPEDQIAASASLIANALDSDLPSAVRGAALAEVGKRAAQALDAGRPVVAPHRSPLHWPLAFPEVFDDRRTGFDAMVANPPFLGGTKISGPMGSDYRQYIATRLAGRRTDRADLVSFFFLRAAEISDGFGFLATNSISQGDTREVALDRLTSEDWTIHRAVKSTQWPGEATLEIAKVWMRRQWSGLRHLGEDVVPGITTSLDRPGRVVGDPYRLAAYRSDSFQGSKLDGIGFTLDPDEAHRLIAKDPRNAEVIEPYLVGEDVNSRPDCSASRFVINFRDWSLERSQQYPDCILIIEERVKPDRLRNNREAHRRYWWRYGDKRPELYSAISRLQRVLVLTTVSKPVMPVFVAAAQVLSKQLTIWIYDDDYHFGILTSSFHWWWTIAHGSTLETRVSYTPTDCFDTFPQPPYETAIEAAGNTLDEHRSALMVRNNEGLTKTYNRVHNPDDHSPGIPELRDLHLALDLAVRDAYGWSDLDLDHGFWDTPQGRRFTLGPAARTEVLDRLLELNHRRYAEEVAAGLHEKRKPGGARRRASQSETLL